VTTAADSSDPSGLLEMRPKLAPKTKLRLDPKTGKHILLYPEKGLLLNPTGTAILQLCTGEHTLSGIVALLCTQFQSTPEQLQPEVLAFVKGLLDRGLLQAAP
jgi:pyrroloquinoline quinone biosynthesis protein D